MAIITTTKIMFRASQLAYLLKNLEGLGQIEKSGAFIAYAILEPGVTINVYYYIF